MRVDREVAEGLEVGASELLLSLADADRAPVAGARLMELRHSQRETVVRDLDRCPVARDRRAV